VSDGCTISGRDRAKHRAEFKIDPEKSATTWGKQGRRKLFMSPTAHDTFPENVNAMIAAWKRMLDAGHYLVIVSKPLLPCIDKITTELAGYKDRVLFRFTITSNNQEILDEWELFAPTFDERVSCLKLVKERGFIVSVSMEPFLSDPVETVKTIREHVNGEIWIGMMNGFPSEKIIGKPFSSKLKTEIERVKQLYALGNIERIVEALRGDPAIQWKESFIKIYGKRGEKR
jgi:DNA repair photolyase